MYGFGLRERVLLEAREHETALARPQAQQAQPSAQASQQQAPPP
jgi:hypothetical protein